MIILSKAKSEIVSFLESCMYFLQMKIEPFKRIGIQIHPIETINQINTLTSGVFFVGGLYIEQFTVL